MLAAASGFAGNKKIALSDSVAYLFMGKNPLYITGLESRNINLANGNH
jgi:hypothetical protein